MKKLHIALLVKAYKINGTHYKAFIPEGIISGYLHEKTYEDYFEVNGKNILTLGVLKMDRVVICFR